MSYTCLVADAYHPHACGEELSDHVIFFVVESGAPKMSHCSRLHYRMAVATLLKRAIPCLPHAVGDHVHRLFEIEFSPFLCVRSSILHRLETAGMCVQFVCVSALGTQVTSRDRRFWISFNRDQLSSFVICELSAPYPAVRANRTSDFRAVRLREQLTRALSHCLGSRAISTSSDLFQKRPATENFFKHPGVLL